MICNGGIMNNGYDLSILHNVLPISITHNGSQMQYLWYYHEARNNGTK